MTAASIGVKMITNRSVYGTCTRCEEGWPEVNIWKKDCDYHGKIICEDCVTELYIAPQHEELYNWQYED